MSQAIVTEGKLVAIGDAIRQQLGTSVSYTLDEMASAIASISGGGGGGGNLSPLIDGTITDLTDTGATKVNHYLCFENSNLQNVSLQNASEIGIYAFGSCSNLSSIFFPNVKKIGGFAFYYCLSLQGADLPELLRMEYGSALSNCAFNNCGITTFNAPKLSYVEGTNTFYNCSKLTTVNIESVTSLVNCENMFNQCAFLQSISMPLYSGVIFDYMFAYCTRLEDAYIPNATEVKLNAFYLANHLKKIDFPNMITVRTSAFYGCSVLSQISLPLCSYIDGTAFRSCSSLTEVHLPNVSFIGANAFRSDIGIKRFKCDSLQTISQSVFLGCSNFSIFDLTSASVVPQLMNINALNNTPMSNSTYLGYFGSIYVPASLYTAFTTSTNWVNYSARITSDPVPA